MPASGRPLLEPWDDENHPGELLGSVRIGFKTRAVLALAPLGTRLCVHVQRQLWSEERQSWESRGGLLSLALGESLDNFIAALERGGSWSSRGPIPRRTRTVGEGVLEPAAVLRGRASRRWPSPSPRNVVRTCFTASERRPFDAGNARMTGAD